MRTTAVWYAYYVSSNGAMCVFIRLRVTWQPSLLCCLIPRRQGVRIYIAPRADVKDETCRLSRVLIRSKTSPSGNNHLDAIQTNFTKHRVSRSNRKLHNKKKIKLCRDLQVWRSRYTTRLWSLATIFPLFSAANAPKKDMSQKESQNVITWATHHVHRSRENQQMYMNIKNGSTLTGPRFKKNISNSTINVL